MDILEVNTNILAGLYGQCPQSFEGITLDGNMLKYNGQDYKSTIYKNSAENPNNDNNLAKIYCQYFCMSFPPPSPPPLSFLTLMPLFISVWGFLYLLSLLLPEFQSSA